MAIVLWVEKNVRSLRALFLGVIVGITISVVTEYVTETSAMMMLRQRDVYDINQPAPVPQQTDKPNFDMVVKYSEKKLENDLVHKQDMDTSGNQTVKFSDIFPPGPAEPGKLHAGESDLSDAMSKSIRILCWVMTQPNNHKERALSVRATWGKRCNILYFVSTAPVTLPTDDNTTNWEEGPPLVTAIYSGSESRSILWGKTKTGFRYAYDNYFDQADWFVKADDDTFLVIDNLRLLLMDKDPAQPIYYGCKFKVIVTPNGYMSGGAGYVLSREALKRLVEKSLPDKNNCRQDDDGSEDVEIGRCLQSVGVEAGDARDTEGHMRFFPFTPQSHASPGHKDPGYWYWQYMYYDHEQGVECCSDSIIAFHYVDRGLLYALEYLIYHVHPFGIHPKLTGSHVKNQIELYLKQKKPCNVTKTPK